MDMNSYEARIAVDVFCPDEIETSFEVRIVIVNCLFHHPYTLDDIITYRLILCLIHGLILCLIHGLSYSPTPSLTVYLTVFLTHTLYV